MMDLSDKASDCEGMSNHTVTLDRVSAGGSNVMTCADCGTSKTPLWRGGPDGPKSLCNACGIRSRKKRRALMGVTKEDKKNKKSGGSKNSRSTSSSSGSGDNTPLVKKLWAFGREDVALQRPRSNSTRRRKLGEVEQAAFLLMALSCGSVYA